MIDRMVLEMAVPPVKLVDASRAFLPVWSRYYKFMGVVDGPVVEGRVPVLVYGTTDRVDTVALLRK